jgi:hypothetical protein
VPDTNMFKTDRSNTAVYQPILRCLNDVLQDVSRRTIAARSGWSDFRRAFFGAWHTNAHPKYGSMLTCTNRSPIQSDARMNCYP